MRGPAVAELFRVEPHEVKQLVHARGGAGAVPLEDARHGGDVLPHAHVREQADLLNHVADTSTKLHRVDRRDVSALHEHLAGIGVVQAVDELDQRGLAAARGAEHAHELPLVDREAHVVERRVRHTREAFGHVLEFDRCGHLGTP